MFELDETSRALEQAVRAWCEKNLAPAVSDLDRCRILPFDLLRTLSRDLGISEMLVSAAEHRIAGLRDTGSKNAAIEGKAGGGFGGDPMMSSVLLKEVSRVSPGVALSLISTLGCAMAILSQGSASVIERYALPVLRFEKIGAWALTEPGAGSDAFGSMRTTAVQEGEKVVLNGQKTFITNAPFAEVFVIYARVRRAGERGVVRGVVVERGAKGLETGPPMRKMGMNDSPTGEVFLQDCAVPQENVLGGLGGERMARGGAALETLNLERAVMPAMCLGIIERCVEESVRYAKTREQFGQPISEFQAIAFKLARMSLSLENARNLVFKLAWAQRQGKLDARLASLAKLYCAEEAVRVAMDAVQIHGGAGYMAELPLEKLARDAKMFEIGGGTNEIQLQTIARAMLG